MGENAREVSSEEKRAMTCPRCSATLEAGARFCGVCGHRLESQAAGAAAPGPEAAPVVPPDASAGSREPRPDGGKPRERTESKKVSPIAAALAAAGDAYIGTTLNGRFTIENKLGEGGFGAVYNGVQLQTGRKV